MNYFADYKMGGRGMFATAADQEISSTLSDMTKLIGSTNPQERQTNLADMKRLFDKSKQRSDSTLVIAVGLGHDEVLLGESGGPNPLEGHMKPSIKTTDEVKETLLPNGDFQVSINKGPLAGTITLKSDGAIEFGSNDLQSKTTHSADDAVVTVENGGGKAIYSKGEIHITFPDGVHKDFHDLTDREFQKVQTTNFSTVQWLPNHHFRQMGLDMAIPAPRPSDENSPAPSPA